MGFDGWVQTFETVGTGTHVVTVVETFELVGLGLAVAAGQV